MRNKTPKILSLMLLTLALLVLSTLWSSAETAADAADTADAAVDTGELSSGNYQIKVSATHPETGEVFITTRSVQLLAAANGAKFGVRYPFGNGTYGYANNVFAQSDTPMTTLAQAISFIESHRPSAGSTTGTYYICLEENYMLTSTDQSALLAWNRLGSNTRIEFRGRNPGGATRYTLSFGSMMALPQYLNGYENSPKFVFSDIRLSSSSADAPQIIANGCNLTIESDVVLANSIGVTGGGADPMIDFFGITYPDGNSGDLTVTGNTYLHLKAPQSFDFTIATNFLHVILVQLIGA